MTDDLGLEHGASAVRLLRPRSAGKRPFNKLGFDQIATAQGYLAKIDGFESNCTPSINRFVNGR